MKADNSHGKPGETGSVREEAGHRESQSEAKLTREENNNVSKYCQGTRDCNDVCQWIPYFTFEAFLAPRLSLNLLAP